MAVLDPSEGNRVISSDEAKAEGETFGGSRRSARSLRAGADDEGTVLSSKGSASFSIWAGQTCDFQALPWCGLCS